MLSKNQVNEIRALQQKKQRGLKQQFIAEGIKTVLEIIKYQPRIIHHLYGTFDFLEQIKNLPLSSEIPSSCITDDELKRISLLENPNQVLAICNQAMAPNLKYNFTSGFSVYLDGIRDPGNFGTLLRLADWYGISKLFCSTDTCELYNPKVIQASMGAFLRVEVAYTSLKKLLAENSIIHVYGAMMNGVNIYKEKLLPGLIIIGNEANGISEENLKMVNKPIAIPAAPSNKTESLNAAMAAGIICSEFFKQIGEQ